MKLYSIPLLALVSLVSCKNGNSSNTPEVPEPFESFNQRFHSDSMFQLSRIIFPIQGKLIDGSEKQEWTPSNWEMLKEPVRKDVDTTEYKHQLTLSDTTVYERYWIENSGFSVERQFSLKEGKWYLTLYNDANM